MTGSTSFMTREGHGVSRGRRCEPSAAGCPGSVFDWKPRHESAMPVPGTIGPDFAPSLGMHENTLPLRSITPKYDVPEVCGPLLPAAAEASDADCGAPSTVAR